MSKYFYIFGPLFFGPKIKKNFTENLFFITVETINLEHFKFPEAGQRNGFYDGVNRMCRSVGGNERNRLKLLENLSGALKIFNGGALLLIFIPKRSGQLLFC